MLCNLYSGQHLEKTRARFHTENELAPWCLPACTPLEQQRKEMSVLPPPTSWVKVWTYAH